MSKFIHTQALILKRHNYSDADRFITIFSPEYGKLSTIARGVRKLNSRKRATLEPLNLAKLSLVRTGNNFTITEASLIKSFANLKNHLLRLTQATLLLEIIDQLTVEEEPQTDIYYQTIHCLTNLEQSTNSKQRLLNTTRFILENLGFGLPTDPSEQALKRHLESITDRQLKTKEFLTASI